MNAPPKKRLVPVFFIIVVAIVTYFLLGHKKKSERYVILVGTGPQQMVYMSESEPQPYGNGYRFKAVGFNTEITVSGDVQIVKQATPSNLVLAIGLYIYI